MKQLERLLFLQGNRCFFCEQPIPQGEASVEHLVASANGGPKDDENCVVCCKAVNAALGSLSVKGKLRAILSHRGLFSCPSATISGTERPDAPAPAVAITDGRLAQVIADLQKRGSARPRRVATLRNTIAAVFQKKLSEDEVSSLLAALEAGGHIVIDETKVTYALSHRSG
jgi:hypothetical protein